MIRSVSQRIKDRRRNPTRIARPRITSTPRIPPHRGEQWASGRRQAAKRAERGDAADGSASEVVRAGLHLLEEHEAKVKALQDALIAGGQSGPPQPFDNEAFSARMRAKHVP